MPRQSEVVHAHAASAVAVARDAGLQEVGERPRLSPLAAVIQDPGLAAGLVVGRVLLVGPVLGDAAGVLCQSAEAADLGRAAEAADLGRAADEAQRLSDNRLVRQIFYFLIIEVLGSIK